jgi:hypothetical protein
MRRRLAIISCLVILAATMVACAPAQEPPVDTPAPATGDPAGTKLAPGLYDMPDGTVQAIGTLEYRDLEGGFWAVIDGTVAEGDEGSVAAVIANADEFSDETQRLNGLAVIVIGNRLDGASIRMAGPEIEAISITKASDTIDPAE